MSASLEERVRELYVPGVFGHKRVAQALGTSASTVRRMLDPAKRERDRRLSLEAKRRRTGRCEDCGVKTRYNGHAEAVSRYCHPCAARRNGLAARGQGRETQRVLALLAERGPMRFGEMARALGKDYNWLSRYVYQLLLPYGLIERRERGLYALAQPAAEEAGKPLGSAEESD